MSISNTTYQIQATGDGVTQTFSFPFKIFNATQLLCTQINPAGGTPLGPYVLGTDYTVWINPVAEGGTVTWTIAPPLGYVVQLTRQVPYTQSVTLPTEGALPALQISNQLDLMTMMIIQILGVAAPATIVSTCQVLVIGTGNTPSTTNGSWQLIQNGNNLSFQRLEGGVWVEKFAITP